MINYLITMNAMKRSTKETYFPPYMEDVQVYPESDVLQTVSNNSYDIKDGVWI